MKIPDGLARVEGTTFLRTRHELLIDELVNGPIGIMRRANEIDMVLVSLKDWMALMENKHWYPGFASLTSKSEQSIM
jgi:hypothetical protein